MVCTIKTRVNHSDYIFGWFDNISFSVQFATMENEMSKKQKQKNNLKPRSSHFSLSDSFFAVFSKNFLWRSLRFETNASIFLHNSASSEISCKTIPFFWRYSSRTNVTSQTCKYFRGRRRTDINFFQNFEMSISFSPTRYSISYYGIFMVGRLGKQNDTILRSVFMGHTLQRLSDITKRLLLRKKKIKSYIKVEKWRVD